MLTKNRSNEALKSLQWLRGWVKPELVEEEFRELQRYKVLSQSCNAQDDGDQSQPTLCNKIRDILRKGTLIPFILISVQYMLAVFTGVSPYRPYLVQVLYYYESPIDPNLAISYIGWIGTLANISILFTIRVLGKRAIYLLSLAIVNVTCLALSLYGYLLLPNDKLSFDIIGANVTTLIQPTQTETIRYMPLIGFSILSFFGSYGVTSIPNLLNAEVFSLK